jgi:hypothetical protein
VAPERLGKGSALEVMLHTRAVLPLSAYIAARREAFVAHEPAVRHRPQPHVLGALPRVAARRAMVHARLLLARRLADPQRERTWSRAMPRTRCAMIAPRSSASANTA